MGTTEHKRDERLQIIHKCLKNSSARWTVKKLHEKVNRYMDEIGGKRVSTKTIADDLKYLELKKLAPVIVIKRGRDVYYTYEEDFELNQPVIDKEQYVSLVLAKEVLKQLKGFPLAKDLEKLVAKLEHQVEDADVPVYPPIIFEPSVQLKNIERLQEFFECIREKTVLRISYRPFDAKTPVEKIIHPYFLKQYNQRWFLFGYNPQYDNLDNSPIDRIESFKPVSLPFTENTRFPPAGYFKDMIGVTKEKDQVPERIVFRVAASRVSYVATKPFHSSQRLIKRLKNGDGVYEMNIIVNKELISLFLSFGKDLVVQSPKNFKQLIADKINEAAQNY